jgi:hypothetical protein
VQGIGIGPALRKARLLRGKSIEEASRETRIRAEYLHALERESFEALLGDVYVRGFLRSYSTYLGLDPDKVLSVYNRHFGQPGTTLPAPPPGPARVSRSTTPHLPEHHRHHPSWRFLIGVALLLFAIFGAVGLLSRSRSVPPAQNLGASQPSIPALPPPVTVTLRAIQEVHLTVRLNGGSATNYVLRANESRSFQAEARIEVLLSQGGVTAITVNGHALGMPGVLTGSYQASFGPTDFRSPASPSPSGRAHPSPSTSGRSSPSPSAP